MFAEILRGQQRDWLALLAGIDAIYGSPTTILCDEIQNVPGWELIVNRLHRSGRRLILTDDLLLLGAEETGESRETWQGRSAVIRRQPVADWLAMQG